MLFRNLLTILLIAVAALSCGSGQDAASGKIEFILDWKAQMEHSGFFVAQQKGFYREEGLEVKILDGNGAPNAATLVGNGTYKLGVSSGAATVIARAKGVPAVSVAVLNQRSPMVVYALAESDIIKPQDLAWKRVGVNFEGIKYQEYRALLTKLNIDPATIKEIGMAGSDPAPLLAGQVDALLGYTQDQPVQVELRGRKVNRIPLPDYGVNLYSTNLIVNEAFTKDHPDVVRRFVRASIKGWDYAIAHPDEAVSIYHAGHPESNLAFNQANFQHLIPLLSSPDTERMGFGAQSAERWAHTQDTLFDLKRIEKKTDVAALFTNEFLPPKK
ncbi:MAG: ABC transporter substrate-binding protein [Candidatus Latescibacteria bacterium]|nr:ABC transporter substrate-binding protein [Candidatus Latescibacterota bacterium]